MSAEEGETRLKQAEHGDFGAFAKLLTWIERASATEVLAVPGLLEPVKNCFRLGITGPPGAGKSTLVNALIGELRKKQLKVGVLAVDPSSPFTNGAILGDRIRYSEHFLDPGVFIRSLGTRGSLGGLSGAAFLMARAFDATGFDILLIETVGVGQTELDILHVADQVGVVLVPESGDSVQAMKAGLMEIADVFVVNKADRPGADSLAREIEASLHDGPVDKTVPVYKITASEKRGLEPLLDFIENAKAQPFDRLSSHRLRAEAKALLRQKWEIQMELTLKQISNLEDVKRLLHVSE